MTIKYLDSKRIVGLSTDMSSNIVTINHRLSSTDDHAYADLGSALSNSSWVMRYKMVISGYSASSSNPNNSYLFTIAKTNTAEQDTQSLGLKLQIGGSGGSVAKVSGNTSSQSSGEGYGGGGDFTTTVANATWYIEYIRNGADFSVRITTNSDYTGGENKTWSTSGTVENLRYIKYTNRDDSSSSWVLVSTISDIKIYDGVTSATGTFVRDGTWTASSSNKVTVATQDIKPTDIQENSILVEEDTAKRYWFSKAPVVDDDLTTDKGWVSNTSDWTYNATGDYIDFATVRRSTTAQQIYIDVQDSDYLGSGNNLSDTTWTAKFKVRSGASSSSGNVLLYLGFSNNLGDSGTTQQSACLQLNFSPTENNLGLAVSRNNFETTSSPDRINSYIYSSGNLPFSTDFYMEMTRDGDDFTLKAYSDEYVTQVGATATATVTGISSLRYLKAFTDSEQQQSYTSSGTRLYDMEITNGSDTWTFPPTLEDNFPSMSGWVEVVTNGNFQVTGNKLVGETQSGNGGTNGGGIYKDYGLGTFDNSKFVLRCKYQILTQSGGSGNACSLYFGISSTKGDGSASSPNANRDGFAITVTNYASSGMLWNYPNNTTWDNSDTDLSLTPTVADYYLEIARTSPTSVTFTLYSDEYNTVVRTHTQAITADLKDLRYLMFQEWRNSSSNTTKVAVSELKLYNKVSSV